MTVAVAHMASTVLKAHPGTLTPTLTLVLTLSRTLTLTF